MSEVLANVSCVAVGGRGILVRGAPGSGKSSLVLALIDRGATLIGDDGVTLECRDGRVWAAPPPVTGGTIEVRNVGLIGVPVTDAPLCLIIRLDREAPRYIEQASVAELLGDHVPELALFPETPVLPLRAEWALRTHGIA